MKLGPVSAKFETHVYWPDRSAFSRAQAQNCAGQGFFFQLAGAQLVASACHIKFVEIDAAKGAHGRLADRQHDVAIDRPVRIKPPQAAAAVTGGPISALGVDGHAPVDRT